MSARVELKVIADEGSIGSNTERHMHYVVFGVSTSEAAITAVQARTDICPVEFGSSLWGFTFTYIRDEMSFKPLEVLNSGGTAPIVYELSCTWKLLGFSNQPRVAGDRQYSFDVGTQQVLLKKAIATTSYPTGAGTPDTKKMIGWNGQEFAGVNIDVPTFSFTLTAYLAPDDVDDAYIDAVYDCLNNPINDDAFAGRDAGEVKILNVSGTRRNKDADWQVNFNFAGSPNASSLTIGDITGIIKKGWQYLEIEFADTVITADSKKYLYKKPKFVRVHDVYDDSDFSVLGTGL